MKINYQVSAPVFNIQTYCIHDGPGIRSTVFVKGCPLRCRWCANPESQHSFPELMTYESLCKGCGACVPICPKNAITLQQREGAYTAVTDRNMCVNCGMCIDACVYEARAVSGGLMTVREALDKVLKDKIFYDGSGGGMTISGGEALMYPDFSENLLAASHEAGISTAIETSGFANRDVIDKVMSHVDYALMDIKQMNEKKHLQYVGAHNQIILENIRHVSVDMKKHVWLRIPVIPGFNDEIENMHEIGRFAAGLGEDIRVCLLPFHKLGESKLSSLGRDGTLGIEPPSDTFMEERKKIMESYGLETQIGG